MNEKIKIIPKSWDHFQQYKDRKPQWIKLHRDLLNDFAYSSVRIGTKATLPLLWLLSCENEDGTIEATVEEISFRIHIDKSTVQTAIDELLEIGMYTSVQDCTETYESVPREEKRREERDGDTPFTFTLTRKASIENTSKEYKDKLQVYIESSNKPMTYKDFYDYCVLKDYKYKDFKRAYDSWNKDNKPKKDIEWAM